MAEDRKTVSPLSDNPSLQISPVKLDGTNYLAWSRSCLLFIKARGLQGYVTGDKKRPKSADASYNQWDSENSLVMSWLINSMQPQISRTYLLLDTAEKIWKAASDTYSQLGNDAQIYELRNKIHGTKQGEMPISQYFSELSGLWQELDYYQDFQADCTGDAVKFQKLMEKERIYDFLAGLNVEYDQIRIQVLGKETLPSLLQTYSFIQQEESRRSAMLHSAPFEKAGLAANSSREQPKAIDKDEIRCENCGKPRHTKENCWKLHGRPNRGRGGKRGGSVKGHANMTEGAEPSSDNSTTTTGTLSNDEIQNLRRLLSQLDSSSIGTSNFVKSGDAFLTNLDNFSWIIDSGANRHMTGSSQRFLTYSPCTVGDKVRIADGSFTPVSGTGSVVCHPKITLSSVLHVPRFPVNLLSVSSITKALNCKIEFFPEFCVFQDLQTGKTIGSGRLQDGLYVLDGGQSSVTNQVFLCGNKDVNLEIIQWHRRYKTENGQKLEPVEEVTIEVNEEHVGLVMEALSHRRGEITDMGPVPGNVGRTRVCLTCPSRGLVGYRSVFNSDTRGTGFMHRAFLTYEKYRGPLGNVRKGVLVSMGYGTITAHALMSLEARGILFVKPGMETYDGMIIGEHTRDTDLDVNPVRTKELTNVRAACKDENVKLTPPRLMTLEEAIGYVASDELIEVTPNAIRLRKRYLDVNKRKAMSKKPKE